MAKTFFFYDLETSGLNPRTQRIMQFAGIRTDLELRPIDESIDILIQLSEDILPDPEAILVTGTTPQQTVENGISEPEFCKILTEQIFTPDTIIVGFNNIRFDDEFIRHTLWRNFYDPYEWSWQDGRSRWDMLDVVRMTRALRPDGIIWPTDDDGQPTNRLEELAKANHVSHIHAHDALSDVEATIGIAKLIQKKQPKLFSYLLNMRQKKAVAELVNLDSPKPFVYASGKYGKARNFVTIAFPIAPGPRTGSVLVYDLSVDPSLFSDWTIKDIHENLASSYEERQKETFISLPIKELQYNRCPAVAPLNVVNQAAWQRLGLDEKNIKNNLQNLLKSDLSAKAREAFDNRPAFPSQADVEHQLYDSFLPDQDRTRTAAVRAANAQNLAALHLEFIDERLPELLLRYKARQFPTSLSEAEQSQWETYRTERFQIQAPLYIKKLQELSQQHSSGRDQFLLEELRLWFETTAPIA